MKMETMPSLKMRMLVMMMMMMMNSDKGVEKTRHNLQESKLDLNLVSLLSDHNPVLLQTVPNLLGKLSSAQCYNSTIFSCHQHFFCHFLSYTWPSLSSTLSPSSSLSLATPLIITTITATSSLKWTWWCPSSSVILVNNHQNSTSQILDNLHNPKRALKISYIDFQNRAMKIIPGELKFGSHLNVIRAVTLRSEHFALKENIICAVTLPSEYFAFYLCSHFAFLFSTKAVIPSFLSFVPNDAWKIKKSETFSLLSPQSYAPGTSSSQTWAPPWEWALWQRWLIPWQSPRQSGTINIVIWLVGRRKTCPYY